MNARRQSGIFAEMIRFFDVERVPRRARFNGWRNCIRVEIVDKRYWSFQGAYRIGSNPPSSSPLTPSTIAHPRNRDYLLTCKTDKDLSSRLSLSFRLSTSTTRSLRPFPRSIVLDRNDETTNGREGEIVSWLNRERYASFPSLSFFFFSKEMGVWSGFTGGIEIFINN